MKTSYRNLSTLKREIADSEELASMLKERPIEFFENLKFNNPVEKPWVFALIVSVIGLALVISIAFIGIISLSDPYETTTITNGITEKGTLVRQIPQVFGIIASSSIAAIAGLLAPSPIRNKKE